MDKIDAITRNRGDDNQGDAGIARDSVVNQYPNRSVLPLVGLV